MAGRGSLRASAFLTTGADGGTPHTHRKRISSGAYLSICLESCTQVDVTEFNPLRDPIPTSFAVGRHFVTSSQVMDGVSSASRFLLRPRPAACCSPQNAERRSPARGDIAGSTAFGSEIRSAALTRTHPRAFSGNRPVS
jgi:hypothetical protein